MQMSKKKILSFSENQCWIYFAIIFFKRFQSKYIIMYKYNLEI